jgi:hypothetical protein
MTERYPGQMRWRVVEAAGEVEVVLVEFVAHFLTEWTSVQLVGWEGSTQRLEHTVV